MHESIGAQPLPAASTPKAVPDAKPGSVGPESSSASGSGVGGGSSAGHDDWPKQLEHSSLATSSCTAHASHMHGQSLSAQSIMPSQSSSTPSAQYSSAVPHVVASEPASEPLASGGPASLQPVPRPTTSSDRSGSPPARQPTITNSETDRARE